MTKERLRIIMGENIRNERLARDMSIDELAELLELTSGFVGLIERGQRGATPITLFKLSSIFGISIDNIFQCREGASVTMADDSHNSVTQVKRNKIASLVSDLTCRELEFIINIVKSLREMNRDPKANDENSEDDD